MYKFVDIINVSISAESEIIWLSTEESPQLTSNDLPLIRGELLIGVQLMNAMYTIYALPAHIFLSS